MDRYEREALSEGYHAVAGIDEAGRGPLAGPVVAAAVCFTRPIPVNPLIRDSKELSPLQRSAALLDIYSSAAAVGIGIVWHEEVDRLNIHRATLRAMEAAVKDLSIIPDMLLIDGRFPIKSEIPQRTIVGGDRLSISIAAASIVAKTTRDHIMAAYHKIFPEYGFETNMGYGTKAHMGALARVGASPVHRRSYRGVLGPKTDNEGQGVKRGGSGER
jgi:ribonuclease HII